MSNLDVKELFSKKNFLVFAVFHFFSFHLYAQVNFGPLLDATHSTLQEVLRDYFLFDDIFLELRLLTEPQLKSWNRREELEFLELQDKLQEEERPKDSELQQGLNSFYESGESEQQFQLWLFVLGPPTVVGATEGTKYVLLRREIHNTPPDELLEKLRRWEIIMNDPKVDGLTRNIYRARFKRRVKYIKANRPDIQVAEQTGEALEAIRKGFASRVVFMEGGYLDRGYFMWRVPGQPDLPIYVAGHHPKMAINIASTGLIEEALLSRATPTSNGDLTILNSSLFNHRPLSELFLDAQLHPKTQECYVLFNPEALAQDLAKERIETFEFERKTYYKLKGFSINRLSKLLKSSYLDGWLAIEAEALKMLPQVSEELTLINTATLEELAFNNPKYPSTLMKELLARAAKSFVPNFTNLLSPSDAVLDHLKKMDIFRRQYFSDVGKSKLVRELKVLKGIAGKAVGGVLAIIVTGALWYYFNEHSIDRFIEILEDPRFIAYHPWDSRVIHIRLDFFMDVVAEVKKDCWDRKKNTINREKPCKVRHPILLDLPPFAAIVRGKREIPVGAPLKILPPPDFPLPQ